MADHTGKRTVKRAKKRIDTSSIKMTTLLSFVVFALFLVMVLLSVSNFYLNTFYERARSQEVVRLAETLESQLKRDPSNFGPLALQAASTNNIYIRVSTGNEAMAFDGTKEAQDSDTFEEDLERIMTKLESSGTDSVSETRRETSGTGLRMIYASYVSTRGTVSTLCIIAPLYPDPVTVRILRSMLIYISIIVLIIALLMAFALSIRLSAPIEKLTNSATELSKGNHDVHFDGAGFTETKELARALNKAAYEMEKTDFYQREIIANVSHDLKTPLTMIRSYAEKIMDITGDNPEKRNADLNVIISETEHLNRLVSDMLSVSNLQSNNVAMNMETFDLVQAAQSVYESFLALATSEGFEIYFHPCRPAYVVGDRTRLTQVMTNFVSNAVKYSGDNKYIDIRLSRSNRKVTFHCIDHGMGIPSDEIGHVWDKYYRTSANHERGIEGTGLGLAIVKGILNLHGAKYGVESEEGKGSDFWFEMETVKKPAAEDTEKKDG